jgi:hypothetical protein
MVDIFKVVSTFSVVIWTDLLVHKSPKALLKCNIALKMVLLEF